MKRAIRIGVCLAFLYLSGVFWIPPEVGMYLYAERPARIRHFATEAGIEHADKSCAPRFKRAQASERDMTECFDKYFREGKTNYLKENL